MGQHKTFGKIQKVVPGTKPTGIASLNWISAVIVVMIGAMNLFWGNNQRYGIFVLLLSVIFFPPMQKMYTDYTGVKIPGLLKVFVGAFIIWSALEVGNLAENLELIRNYVHL